MQSNGLLYPVPVQILTDDSQTINNAATSQLVRRFFLYDNVLGTTAGEAKYIRFLESAEVKYVQKKTILFFFFFDHLEQ